ncbi:MAG: PTS sugar transporter subunit IIC, partial [Selenomonadaceae bacterium]|nr:PTS sugar transporter subunit IIC [Selenomonadaceae bacterium]
RQHVLIWHINIEFLFEGDHNIHFFEAMAMHVQGLAIAILVFSRHESWRGVSRFSLPAALFNIYEPVMFCLPVVLNPLFLIPFLMAPLANVLLGWVAVSWGIVPIFKAGFSWNMPLLLSGALGTSSFMGGILQVVCLVMDIFIYAPFVITANMLEFRGEEPEEGEEG